MSSRFLIPPGEGPVLRTENEPLVRIDPQRQGVGAMVLEHAVAPGTLGTPHLHTDEDQVAYVLAGRLGFRVGEEEFLADAGSLVARPRGLVHALWNPTDEPARMLEISLPGGVLSYFKELDAILAAGGDEAAAGRARGRSGVELRPELIPELERRHGVRREEGEF